VSQLEVENQRLQTEVEQLAARSTVTTVAVSEPVISSNIDNDVSSEELSSLRTRVMQLENDNESLLKQLQSIGDAPTTTAAVSGAGANADSQKRIRELNKELQAAQQRAMTAEKSLAKAEEKVPCLRQSPWKFIQADSHPRARAEERRCRCQSSDRCNKKGS